MNNKQAEKTVMTAH